MASPCEALASLKNGAALRHTNVSLLSVGARTRSSKKRSLEEREVKLQHNQYRKRARLAPALSSGKLTQSDKERMEALRRQPLVIILDLLYIQCKRCGGRIKLSETCLYDPQHWLTHRERCDKWSDAQATAKRKRNVMGATRLSTSSLTYDDDSELTEMSVKSERSSSPSPDTSQQDFTPGPLTSHLKAAEYFALAHPGTELIDLNAPLSVVPSWSCERLKLPAYVDTLSAETARQRCTLSLVDWDKLSCDEEDIDDDAASQDDTVSPSGPPSPAPPEQTIHTGCHPSLL